MRTHKLNKQQLGSRGYNYNLPKLTIESICCTIKQYTYSILNNIYIDTIYTNLSPGIHVYIHE